MKERLFGIVGYPLLQTSSPGYFRQKWEKENIKNTSYQIFPLKTLSEFMTLIESKPDLVGLNVTIPYKVSIIEKLHELSEEAKAIGAVNVIKISRHNDKAILTGFNTDAIGFERSITPLMRSHHRAALILGTGGASRAAAYVFQKIGIDYFLVSRDPHGKNHIGYDNLTMDLFESHTIVVNASPMGMFPDIDSCPPLPYEYLSGHHLIFDMVYNPAETVFLQKGKAAGAAVLNGLPMLHQQAEATWQIWNE